MVETAARITVSNLEKRFGRQRALRGVSHEFSAGTVTALVGANGSGKTTLLRMLAQLSRPTAGTIKYTVDDRMLSKHGARAAASYVSHAVQLYPDLSGAENAAFFADLQPGPNGDTSKLVEALDAASFWNRRVGQLSRGQAQRVSLVCALSRQPKFLLLDEPETGLDHQSVDALCACVRDSASTGSVVVLVSHSAPLVDALCDQKIMLQAGRVIDA